MSYIPPCTCKYIHIYLHLFKNSIFLKIFDTRTRIRFSVRVRVPSGIRVGTRLCPISNPTLEFYIAPYVISCIYMYITLTLIFHISSFTLQYFNSSFNFFLLISAIVVGLWSDDWRILSIHGWMDGYLLNEYIVGRCWRKDC